MCHLWSYKNYKETKTAQGSCSGAGYLGYNSAGNYTGGQGSFGAMMAGSRLPEGVTADKHAPVVGQVAQIWDDFVQIQREREVPVPMNQIAGITWQHVEQALERVYRYTDVFHHGGCPPSIKRISRIK